MIVSNSGWLIGNLFRQARLGQSPRDCASGFPVQAARRVCRLRYIARDSGARRLSADSHLRKHAAPTVVPDRDAGTRNRESADRLISLPPAAVDHVRP